MIQLTGFADEISPELDVQIEVLQSEKMKNVEFRGVWGKNVLKLTDEELERVKKEFDQNSISVSSIGSPIGKIKITDDFEQHLKDFDRALEIAKFFHSPYIRVFSFFIPEGEDPGIYRDEVLYRMKTLTERVEGTEIVLLHENEKDIYGDTTERCLEILEHVNSKNLRCAFDPANFVQCGVKPYTEAYSKLLPFIEYLHIKDARFEDGKVVPVGEGDGEVREILSALKINGYDGFMSLEPHLKAAEIFQGFSGPDLFKVATLALKNILAETNWQWN
ncbi:sugar phosphate isomerase/epimerase family protein [Neobacillus ginsengisoli]|uniref:Sugar phosphate isomerase/epimerase n=1 Tax=Neobacillus ginsengisoli TaxID=904295 RepID=A0ABT9Y1I6_9BACI|nr:sugar phosphate isomerase/epimerase family protein [Neobacillus ginsengisoli]MDQ0201451.1 sugar phosphate isomerase/epimerase [Neobacillus ginsengisoli]